jgi:hypothetical protein
VTRPGLRPAGRPPRPGPAPACHGSGVQVPSRLIIQVGTQALSNFTTRNSKPGPAARWPRAAVCQPACSRRRPAAAAADVAGPPPAQADSPASQQTRRPGRHGVTRTSSRPGSGDEVQDAAIMQSLTLPSGRPGVAFRAISG